MNISYEWLEEEGTVAPKAKEAKEATISDISGLPDGGSEVVESSKSELEEVAKTTIEPKLEEAEEKVKQADSTENTEEDGDEQKKTEKVEMIDTSGSVYELLQGKNVMTFLQSSGKTMEEIKSSIDKSEKLFAGVLERYCNLGGAEATSMAKGVFFSLVDSVTHQINVPDDAEKVEDGKKVEKGNGTGFDMMKEIGGAAMDIFGKGEKGSFSIDNNQIFGRYNDLAASLGAGNVLRSRMKAVYLLMELTRKAKVIYGNDALRDQSIITQPQSFVGSVRILDTAITANKDLIQPEFMKKKTDFNQKISLVDNSNGSSQDYNLMDLLGAKRVDGQAFSANSTPSQAAELFEDIASRENYSEEDKKKASIIVDAMNRGADSGLQLMSNRKANEAMLPSAMKELVTKALEIEKKFTPEGETGFISGIIKRLQPIIFAFTGTHFDIPEYDSTNAEGGAQNAEVAEQVAKETGVQAAGVDVGKFKKGIYANESIGEGDPYEAINPNSTAVGKYQFLMGDRGDKIGNFMEKNKIAPLATTDPEYIRLLPLVEANNFLCNLPEDKKNIAITFLSNDSLQEQFMTSVIEGDYVNNLTVIKNGFKDKLTELGLDDASIMMGIHFLGSKGFVDYLTQGKDSPGVNKSFSAYWEEFKEKYNS